METTKMTAPDDCDSVTHGGETYSVKDGRIEVPSEAVEALLAHGFTVFVPNGPGRPRKQA